MQRTASPILCLLALGSAMAAEPASETFAAPAALSRFAVTGEVTIDATKSASADGSGSLRLAAKSTAVLKLREEDGSGRVSFKIFEDGAKPADPKARASGAFSGVQQSDGMALVIGPFYAPYLGGDGSYALCNFIPGKDSPFSFVRHLGMERKPGWHAWVYDFDAAKGLTISCDGRAIPVKRFDWNESKQAGFRAVILAGDASDAGGSLWVDDISVTLGGPMQVGPKPPPPPAPVVPERDPAPEGAVPEVVAALREVHPRLLFSAADIPKMKELYASEPGKVFRAALEGYLPACVPFTEAKFLTDATDGQRQGYWRMPTVALHYVLTGDKGSFERTVAYMRALQALPNWETGSELDSGMSAANIMIGAGLALDWLWNDLDPAFREQFRRTCIRHARAMYHGGHLNKNNAVGYWQNDPANNHRWHRNAGMASCLLAAYSGAPEEGWILGKLKEEMDFVVKWLPEDGTSHESPTYAIFGLSHLVVGAQMVDRCLGTTHLQNPFFRTVPTFMAQSLTPDGKARFNYGDMGGIGVGKLGYDLSLYKCTSVHGLKDEQALLDKVVGSAGAEWGWMGLVWYDPSVTGGDPARLKVSQFFDDVGVLFARDGWKDDGVGVMLKCGPFGGYTLNRYRATGGKEPKYINVAHDDPDANTFLIYARNRYLVESDRYSEDKKSANHNTVLINGMGQMAEGRPEGGVWSQPGGDMTRMGVVTALQLGERVDVIEGEAGGSYLAASDKKSGKSRPALERFRRALVFAKGSYVLVLDDIRAPQPVEISWLVQGPELQAVEGTPRAYRLVNKDADCPFRLATDRDAALAFAIVDSPADTKAKEHGKVNLLGWKQLRMTTTSERLFSAAAFDVYQRGLAVSLDAADPAKVVVRVQGKDVDDAWTWQPAAKADATYTLTGTRGGQPLATVGEADRPKAAQQP